MRKRTCQHWWQRWHIDTTTRRRLRKVWRKTDYSYQKHYWRSIYFRYTLLTFYLFPLYTQSSSFKRSPSLRLIALTRQPNYFIYSSVERRDHVFFIYIYIYIYIYWPNEYCVRQWSGRPEFNPWSSHAKDSKMVLHAALLSTQHYKMKIKGKVEQSRDGVPPSPTPRCSCFLKGNLRVPPD